MNSFKELYEGDLANYNQADLNSWLKKYLYYFRKVTTCQNKYLNLYYRFQYRRYSAKHDLEIPREVKIGKGFYLGHPYHITVSSVAVLGEYVSLHKGVTIGHEARGKRKGAPNIGNYVWIGINSTIVGRVNIGDDVLIAPNSFVNCDIPSHSVVVGNPCIITHKEDAVKGYIHSYKK